MNNRLASSLHRADSKVLCTHAIFVEVCANPIPSWGLLRCCTSLLSGCSMLSCDEMSAAPCFSRSSFISWELCMGSFRRKELGRPFQSRAEAAMANATARAVNRSLQAKPKAPRAWLKASLALACLRDSPATRPVHRAASHWTPALSSEKGASES